MDLGKTQPLIMPAPAKVNLFLHVTGRRADGYHLLDSLAVFADTGDAVTLTPAPAFEFTVDGPFAHTFTAAGLSAAPDSANLAVRAAHALAAATGRALDMRLRLTKTLPPAAGLGGGSADAAAVLRALLAWWKIEKRSVPDLYDILCVLGADVPVCLESTPARMGGIGENLAPVPPLPPLPALLVNPGVPCPTTAVFASRKGPYGAPAPACAWQDREGLLAFLTACRNDLTAPAIARAPVIAACLNALAEQEGCLLARLSGSGASVFGLFSDPLETLDAAERVTLAHPDWWVRACTLGGL